MVLTVTQRYTGMKYLSQFKCLPDARNVIINLLVLTNRSSLSLSQLSFYIL